MNQNRKKMSETVKKRGPKKKAKGERKRHVQFYIKESILKKYRRPENLLKPEILAENE